jgi:hypothetical protein
MAAMDLSRRNRRAAGYGTAIVLVNLVLNLVHGAAHLELHIDLSAAEWVFVVVVILAGPLVAMALLWTPWRRLGLGLLALTMAGSLVFGLYHHLWPWVLTTLGRRLPGCGGPCSSLALVYCFSRKL